MPLEPVIQLARSEEQIQAGERVYRELLHSGVTIPTGERVGIELATRRVFRRRSDAQPEQLAAEQLDAGLLYLRTWGVP